MEWDPRYIRGVEFFNNEEFFEAHEVWEDWWHATHDKPKDFIQGLIQVTSSLHHMQTGNMRGARILHDSGIKLLEPYGDFYMGLDLKLLRGNFNAALREILDPPLDQLYGRGHPGSVKVSYSKKMAFKIELKEEPV